MADGDGRKSDWTEFGARCSPSTAFHLAVQVNCYGNTGVTGTGVGRVKT